MAAQGIQFPEDLKGDLEHKPLTDTDISARVSAGIIITRSTGEFHSYSARKVYKRVYFRRSFKLQGNRSLDKIIGFDPECDTEVYSENHLEKYSVIYLRDILTEKGIDCGGKKSVLIKKILDSQK